MVNTASEYAESIVNTVREPLVVLDDKFRVISANRSFYRSFKVTPETSENTLLFDLGNGQWEIPKLRELLEKVLPKSTTIEDFEVEHNFPDIGQKTMLMNARRIQTETGATQMILLAIDDITERKRLEETLHQSEEKYHTLFESTRDALMTLAPPSWTFTSCNPAALEMFGAKDESEFTSVGPWDLSPDLQPDGQSSADMAREMIEKALRDGSFLFEWTHRRLGGEEFPATVLLTRMEIGGETVVEATVRDITERKAAEEALLRANKELEGYAHTVSHDLKGPLAVIALAAQTSTVLLNEPVTEETRRKSLEIAELLDISVMKCSKLVEDLLALAEAGQVPSDTRDVNVADVVSRILEEKAGPLLEKKINVKVGGNLGQVRANQTHIYQVFTNLIGNAVNHCKSEAPVIEVSYLGEEDGGHHYLVRDNGEGIPPENLDKVFEPFFKGESGGAGIGLTTLAKIVNVYDGSIRAYNNNGACFEFTLRDFDEGGL